MQESLFTVSKLDDFVPADHPLRPVRLLVNEAFSRLNGLFDTIYADSGRDSIAPEKLMRAPLLQVFYSVRSERMRCKQMRYNLLFRWFVGIPMGQEIWNHSAFSKNRDRLLEHEVVEAFFTEIVTLADKRNLLSKEHFSVDSPMIQAWASQKSFRPKDEPDADVRYRRHGVRGAKPALVNRKICYTRCAVRLIRHGVRSLCSRVPWRLKEQSGSRSSNANHGVFKKPRTTFHSRFDDPFAPLRRMDCLPRGVRVRAGQAPT